MEVAINHYQMDKATIPILHGPGSYQCFTLGARKAHSNRMLPQYKFLGCRAAIRFIH